MLLLMLRSLVFAVSVAGYLMLLNKKFSVIMEFAPAVYCSSCVSLLYVAGLLNILPEMAAAITIGGVLCAVWGARAKLRFPGRTWCIIGCFGLVSLYFAYLLLGVQFTNTDNFTHWGLAIREMLLLDRMPNFTDEVILFQAYPMGTALWGYYVCRVVGLGDTCFAFVQQLMQLCFLLPLFAWITRKKWYLIFLPVSYALYAMCSNIAVSDLLVDSLLAIAAVALFAIGAYYRDRKETAVWCAMPMLVLLLQIKNSGVFFFAAYLVYILISWRGELGARKSLRNQFLVLNGLIPAASLVLWNKHVKYVFPNGDDSLHAMSASYFESVFGEKTLDEICRIFADVWASAASPKTAAFALLLLLTAAIAIAMVCCAKNRKKLSRWAVLLCADWAFYLVYVMGLFATYVFSMSSLEAEELTSFSRYIQTGGIFIFGYTIIHMMQYIEVENSTRKVPAAILVLALAMGPFWNPGASGFRFARARNQLIHRSDNSTTVQTAVQQHMETYGWIPEKMSVFVYYNQRQRGMEFNHLEHLLRYEFRTNSLSFFDDVSRYLPKIDNEEADYLYIWTPDAVSDGLLQELGFPDKCGQEGVIINLMGLKK